MRGKGLSVRTDVAACARGFFYVFARVHAGRVQPVTFFQ